MTDSLVFTASNRHGDSCGSPPGIVATDDGYQSYFENEHGEQWVFLVKRGSKDALLFGGDIDWDNPLTVSADPDDEELPYVRDLVLNPPEMFWLTGCWNASKLRRKSA